MCVKYFTASLAMLNLDLVHEGVCFPACRKLTLCFTDSPQDDGPSWWLCILSGLFVYQCARCGGANLAGGYPIDALIVTTLPQQPHFFVDSTNYFRH